MMYTAAFTGSPNGALLSNRALVLQGSLIGPDPGRGRRLRVPQLRAAVPRGHVHDHAGHLPGRRDQRVHAPGGRRGAVPAHRRGALHRAASSCRPPWTRSSSSTPTAATTCKTLRGFPGQARVDGDDHRGRQPVGDAVPPATARPRSWDSPRSTRCSPASASSGRPAPFVRIAVLDPDGAELGPGETGEIAVRGPTVMNGYFNRPELNEQRQAGGWHHTNDLGRIEADGSLTFIGPKTRLIKSAAENIYPTEVEGCLKHPPRRGRRGGDRRARPHLGPERHGGGGARARAPTASAEEIIEHCRERIASYKKPKRVEFTDVAAPQRLRHRLRRPRRAATVAAATRAPVTDRRRTGVQPCTTRLRLLSASLAAPALGKAHSASHASSAFCSPGWSWRVQQLAQLRGHDHVGRLDGASGTTASTSSSSSGGGSSDASKIQSLSVHGAGGRARHLQGGVHHAQRHGPLADHHHRAEAPEVGVRVDQRVGDQRRDPHLLLRLEQWPGAMRVGVRSSREQSAGVVTAVFSPATVLNEFQAAEARRPLTPPATAWPSRASTYAGVGPRSASTSRTPPRP